MLKAFVCLTATACATGYLPGEEFQSDAGTKKEALTKKPDNQDAEVTKDPDTCPSFQASYMQDCQCDEQCVSGLCRAAGPGGAMVCTRSCSTSSDCPTTDICTEWIDEENTICAANDTGEPCVDQTYCAAHACLFRPDLVGGGICTVYCTTQAKCPDGYGCLHPDYDPTLEICTPIGSACPTGAAQCYSAACFVSGATGEQYCSGDCSDQDDCPEGYVCEQLNSSSTRTVCKQ